MDILSFVWLHSKNLHALFPGYPWELNHYLYCYQLPPFNNAPKVRFSKYVGRRHPQYLSLRVKSDISGFGSLSLTRLSSKKHDGVVMDGLLRYHVQITLITWHLPRYPIACFKTRPKLHMKLVLPNTSWIIQGACLVAWPNVTFQGRWQSTTAISHRWFRSSSAPSNCVLSLQVSRCFPVTVEDLHRCSTSQNSSLHDHENFRLISHTTILSRPRKTTGKLSYCLPFH